MQAMRHVPVESSALTSVGFDAAASTLEIKFSSGQVYRYFGVPPAVYEELMAAGSRGSYFSEQIRNRYRFERR
jgi:hypothetical protein